MLGLALLLACAGHADPVGPEVLQVDRERVSYWASKGARLSDTVRTLIARHPAPPPGADVSEPTAESAPPPVASADEPADTSGGDTQVAT